MKIPFLKMHGLGNDFIFLNTIQLPIEPSTEFITNIANRRTGIGCDQLILYSSTKEHNEMQIFNQDGSHAKACGNATRCLAHYLMEQKDIKKLRIHIGEKTFYCQYIDSNHCSVNMGTLSFNEPWMPNEEQLWEISESYDLNTKDIITVDVGNPHLVIFYKDLTLENKKTIGKKMQNNNLFPGGINVNFVKINQGQLKLLTWERGAGFTLACGTGSCASFAAAKYLGIIKDNEALISLKLGNLTMQLDENRNIIMTGKVEKIAEGIYYL